MRLSDYVANFLRINGVDCIFTITGAGNLRLIESVVQQGISYVCPHHEQAAIMASLSRWRISGCPAINIVTGGPGSSNTLTAVADAFLDSIPCIIIAGQEKSEYMDSENRLRGKGVQGLDMVSIMRTVTKFAECLHSPRDIRRVLEQAFHEAFTGRPGPVWIDIPQDMQWADIDPATLPGFSIPDHATIKPDSSMQQAAIATLDLVAKAQRPLLWVGHGIRLSRSESVFQQLLESLGVPVLVSWQAADLVPDSHPLFVGRAGTYGQRWANLALQNCDLLITLGTRIALPQRGYEDNEFARAAKKVVVEIDPLELAKFRFNIDVPVLGNVADFIEAVQNELIARQLRPFSFDAWLEKCHQWRQQYPMETLPQKEDVRINSYWFVSRLSEQLTSNDTIVTDMGTSLTCTHAAIKLKKGQRLITSTGLGEMGYGLPGAIGAALGSPDRRTVLICGEGSLMMNLQEFQTLHHLQLPLKIFMLNNDGYLTIKHTHNALFNSHGVAAATSQETGISFPDFSKVAPAFGLKYMRIRDTSNLDDWIKTVLASPGSVFAEVLMPTFQELIPKLAIKVRADGTLYSPPLEDMYPFLDAGELQREMIIPLLKK
jgi:acetolactate synthase-1/2/3 large subunit